MSSSVLDPNSINSEDIKEIILHNSEGFEIRLTYYAPTDEAKKKVDKLYNIDGKGHDKDRRLYR